jgi:hypothetical protein
MSWGFVNYEVASFCVWKLTVSCILLILLAMQDDIIFVILFASSTVFWMAYLSFIFLEKLQKMHE